MNIKLKATPVENDRGIKNEFPDGTKSRTFVVRDIEANICIVVAIYFLPDGSHIFRFVNDLIIQRHHMYSAAEVSLLHAFIGWLSDHVKEVYPTDEHPAGVPLDQIK